MELDHFNAERSRSIHLSQSGIDKKTDANASRVETLYRVLHSFAMRNDIETAFGCNLLALFRNEADFIRHDAQRNVKDLLRIAHFPIQFRHELLAQSLDISI